MLLAERNVVQICLLYLIIEDKQKTSRLEWKKSSKLVNLSHVWSCRKYLGVNFSCEMSFRFVLPCIYEVRVNSLLMHELFEAEYSCSQSVPDSAITHTACGILVNSSILSEILSNKQNMIYWHMPIIDENVAKYQQQIESPYIDNNLSSNSY